MDDQTARKVTRRSSGAGASDAGSGKKIAIIGAGAAGLTAAETLREQGYTQVTIFEKTDCAGGKCSSLEYDGRFYELGAGIIARNNRSVLALADKFAVPYEPVAFGTSILLDAHSGQPLPAHPLPHKLKLLRQLLRYRSLCRRYAALAAPGFAGVPPELCQPFQDWAAHHGLTDLAREFAGFFTGFGYGYLAEVPAAYVLKYYDWATVQSFMRRKIYRFPGGIQHLWTAVAAGHDVRYNSEITWVNRTEAGVEVTANGEVFHFDKVIVTCPLDEFAKFSDASEEEQALFSQIHYCDYRTYACRLADFPNTSGYVPANYLADRAGHPVFWYQRHADSDLFTFYILADWQMTDDAALANISSLVGKLGGRVQELHTVARWKYFPHVDSATMAAGFYDRLEALQGQRHTYYAGELLNFSTVGLTSGYSQNLLQRFFRGQSNAARIFS